jgi:hypothetical protein
VPPVLTLEHEDSFAWQVFHHRHPELVRRVLDAYPYSPEQRRALEALLAESLTGVIADVPADWDQRWTGTPWAKAPFLWAEGLFYQRLLEALGYFDNGVDPFAPFKTAELRDPNLDADFRWRDEISLSPQATFDAMLSASLYGNRADLGFQLVAAESSMHDQLIADDSRRLRQLLHQPGRVTFVLDNAGRELLADLIFADYLLTTGLATEIVLHAKPQPYFVSDATPTDVGDCLRRLTDMPGEPGNAGRRIHQAAADGRLRIRTHPFYCAPLSFHHMPASLAEELATGLTIFKGDLNYRRLVGDRAWEPTSSFQDAVAYLPGPAATLRVLKCEVILGLTPDRVRALDEADKLWRVNGTQALVQVKD